MGLHKRRDGQQTGWGNTTDRMGQHNRPDGATQQMIWGYTTDDMGLHNSQDGATQQMIWGYTRDGLRYTTVGMGQHNR